MVRVNEFGQPTRLPLPEWETPIDAIRAGSDGNYGTSGDDDTDLVHAYEDENAYSYVFSGQWGYLDYALANESLMPSVIGTTGWHINPNEPDILDHDESCRSQTQIDIYEGDNAYRSPDHDPIIVGLDLANPQGDKATDRRIARAVDHVDHSLNADWWTSDQTITNHKVFEFERTTIVQLELAVAAGGPEADAAENAINVLVNADRQLALIELIAAINKAGDASKISAAETAMAEAVELTAYCLYNQAVNAYRAAWRAASKS